MRVRKPPNNSAGGMVAKRFAGWTEADSDAFGALARIAVPARTEQIAILTDLVPARRDEVFTAVELGAGQGALARGILRAFPRCRYLALDRSEHMLAAVRRGLRAYGSRAVVRGFDLAAAAWRRDLPQPLRCVLASLVVHHLTDAEKRRLFKDVAARLEPGGAFLLADLVAPANHAVQQLFAAQWNAAARAQSIGISHGVDGLRRFRRDGWNHYATTVPDPYDRPARLLHQLHWLEDAGFGQVDCFWMHAGHAIFGGYVPRARGAGRRPATHARRRV
jgi:tRNA (cmo5U34)-methyltransferase